MHYNLVSTSLPAWAAACARATPNRTSHVLTGSSHASHASLAATIRVSTSPGRGLRLRFRYHDRLHAIDRDIIRLGGGSEQAVADDRLQSRDPADPLERVLRVPRAGR